MYQFNKHIHKFRELCNGWGIGDETYEFWAWLSKQYTVLADLVDMGCRNGMRLPNLCPPPILASEKARTSLPIMSDSRLLGSGAVNLTGVLVHPGFYYFYGAQCAVERRNKFQASDAAEVSCQFVSWLGNQCLMSRSLCQKKKKKKHSRKKCDPLLSPKENLAHFSLRLLWCTKGRSIMGS
jgi:hypothetical protein